VIDIEEISDDEPKAVARPPATRTRKGAAAVNDSEQQGDDDVKPRRLGALAMASSQSTQASVHDAAPKPAAAAWGDKKKPAARR
jgi:hypothetical protein